MVCLILGIPATHAGMEGKQYENRNKERSKDITELGNGGEGGKREEDGEERERENNVQYLSW